MTDADIKAFAVQHAPKLAENITRLCGQVIAKGIQGHLEHACALQQRVIDLEAALQRIATWDEHDVSMSVDYGSNGVRDYYRRVALDAINPSPLPSP
ncbi:hypothetical protein [Roseateles sp. LKC17W]|uniref:Uncharacterized protein n=1 Tax=Pelomonas margarita TaxID=3299031 RepID=A0ABW7FIF9_9BURK